MTKRWLLAGALIPGALGAQERISLRAAPGPNQVTRLELTQELAFDVVREGTAMGPLKLEGRMLFAGTQRVGAPDREGRLTAQITLDQVTIDLKVNGVAHPSSGTEEQLRGKSFSVVYDAQGKIVEVRAPELPETAGSARDMIKALAGSLPNATLGIGDTVTVPVSIPLPIPIPGIDTGPPPSLESRTTSKLVAIRREGSDRIALLEQTTEAALNRVLEVPSPSGPVAATMEMHLTGSGTMQLNVGKGYVKAVTSDMKLDLSLVMPTRTMTMTGTTRVVVTGTSQPQH